jgi:hypothetical protein
MTSLLFAADLVNRAEPDWWLTPRRMIQTNLREIDAGMDVEAYVASLKAAGANVVLFNVGGTYTMPVLNTYEVVLFKY